MAKPFQSDEEIYLYEVRTNPEQRFVHELDNAPETWIGGPLLCLLVSVIIAVTIWAHIALEVHK